ncbi:MAG: two component transcriptional regulator, two-component system, OmpR family, response regulator [Parcubacteria group bacterium]|nr:two component transcriptional regulator, two-component system, OmpR family, response regulator [Parcubacteria group bacterium]
MAYRIYLVDDDRFLLDMYAVKFKAAGHEVTAFQGGMAVLEALRKDPAPDAVLLDVVMPEIDGFGVLEIIRKEKLGGPAMKVIILSNQGQPSDVERATTLKVDGYIIKASAIPSEVYSETIRIIEQSNQKGA